MQQENKKLGILTGAAYGGGNLAANLLVTTASAFITYFYTEVAGISMAAVGIILAICRLTDGASDLIMGAIVDKTKSRHGKARVWLLRMAPLFCLSSIALWYSPNWGTSGKIAYAAVTYLLGNAIIYTMIAVPYNTLCSRITKDGTERTKLSSFRTFFGFGGALLVNNITLPMVAAFGGGQQGWILVGIVYGVVGAVLYLLTFFRCKEVDTEDSSEKAVADGPQISILTHIKALFRNKYWLMVIGMVLIVFASSGLGAVNVYYTQYIFGDANLVGTLSIAQMVPLMIGSVVVSPIVAKVGKRNVCLVGAAFMIAGTAVMALFSENFAMFFAGMLLVGIGSGPITVGAFAMLADTIEYGEWKTGIRSDGLAYSAETFGEKVGQAGGGVVMSWVLTVGGYVANQAVQDPAAIAAMKVVRCYIPLIISIIVFIILLFYKLDKEYPQVIKELEERRSNA